MAEAYGSAFKRKDGRWAAQYKNEGKRKIVYGKTESDAVQKRTNLLEKLNQSPLIESCNGIELTRIDGSGVCDNEKTAINNYPDKINDNVNSAIHETNTNSLNTDNNECVKAEKCLTGITLGEWLTEWLNSYVKPDKGTSTYTGYGIYINKHIVPVLGDIKLYDLTLKTFQEFFDQKAINGRLDGKLGGISPKSMENMRFMLNSAMRCALENGLIEENYISDVEIQRAVRKEAMALSRDEEARLITICRNYENILAFGIIMALRTGLQLGELLSLKWSSLDMEKKQIYVCRFSKLKTERIISEQDLQADFFSEIEAYRNRQTTLFGSVPDAVIASRTGGYADPGNYNKLFKRILAKSVIPDTNFDVLRNTFALRYLENSLEFTELPRILGCGESSKSLKKYRQLYSRHTK